MPNPYISLDGYDPDVAKIQRQQRLADMLQQQAAQDIPINTYNGQQAPISPFAGLAKMLQAYGAVRGQRKAEEEMQAYRDKDISSAAALARQLTQGTNQVGTPSMPAQTTTIDATMPQLPGGPVPEQRSVQATLPAQQGTGMTTAPPSMNDQLAAILSAHGGPQTQMIQQAMLPQIMQRQNFDYQHGVQRGDLAADRGYAESRAVKRPATPEEKAHYGIDPKTPAEIDVNGNITPITDPNQLTAGQRAQNALGWAQLNKPVSVPFMGQLYDPKTRSTFTPGGAAGVAAPTEVDPNSESLTAQTGLSKGAYDRATGAPNQPRTAALVTAFNKELDDYARKNNVDMSTLRARATGINNIVTQNVMRNNQANILENEITGSVQTVSPILDQMRAGKINKANVFKVWAGGQVNDPAAMQAADQLGRLRDELAGYNAVAGGHLMENGTPAPTPADFLHAEKLISDGISTGGAQAVARSVDMSAKKNRAVLANAIDDANQQLWDAFGKGKNYKRKSAPLDANPGGGGSNNNNVQPATESDIQHTMQVRKMTRAQVLDALKAKGIPVAP